MTRSQLKDLGIQCHTAPFSWKMTFRSDEHWYQLILCANTAQENQVWKKGLSESIANHQQRSPNAMQNSVQTTEQSILNFTVHSRKSVATSSEGITQLDYVQYIASDLERPRLIIIRDAHESKNGTDFQMAATDALHQTKPQSSTLQYPVFNLERLDRQKIEQCLSKVWTRDQLPYPSIAVHRGLSLKQSANTMMRKLSRASITTNSTTSLRRSISYTSIAEASPYSVQIGATRMAQYDGCRDPVPRYSNCLTPTPEPRKSVSFGSVTLLEPIRKPDALDPVGECMTYVTKLRSPYSSPELTKREVSTVSTAFAVTSRESLELERVRGQIVKPKTLLKKLSTMLR